MVLGELPVEPPEAMEGSTRVCVKPVKIIATIPNAVNDLHSFLATGSRIQHRHMA